MSRWNHALCRTCFWERRPTVAVPHQVVDAEPAMCCSCGADAAPGLFYRDDPALYKFCGLSHPEDKDDAG